MPLLTFALIVSPTLATLVGTPFMWAATFFAISALLNLIVVLESAVSACTPSPLPASHPASARSVTIIICAYLPNEQGLIVRTVTQLLRALGKLTNVEVILAYRSPHQLQVEQELRALADLNPSCHLLKVTVGAGKAEQLNEAVGRATGDTLYLLDADALPDSSTLQRLPFLLTRECDVVQGRNLIRNTSHLLGKIVAIEFAAKYMVSHLARSRLAALAYFCGSNCVWQREVALATRFASTSLVEDIEASVRADMNGAKIIIDPSFAATELAPERLVDWWRQRRRWAQGWLELAALHTSAISREAGFSTWKKLNWFYVIYLRRIGYGLVSFGLIGTSVLLSLHGDARGPVVLGLFLLVQMVAGLTQAAAVAVQANRLGEARLRRWWYLLYVLNYPAYDIVKNAVTMAAIAASLGGIREWSVTPRSRNACPQGE